MSLDLAEVQVQDIMTTNPIIIKGKETVRKAAQLMKDAEVGSLIVFDEAGKLQGIVTEEDIVRKSVAEGLDTEEEMVKNIMSSPVHTVNGEKSLKESAELMSKLGIRRLPVKKEGEIVGIVTENDILDISPAMLDITREYEKIQEADQISSYETDNQVEVSGYCESCGVYSDQLVEVSGQLLCPECV